MTNVAVIGTGFIGRLHVQELMRVPRVRVAAVADENLASAKEIAEQYGIDVYTDDYRALLKDPAITVFHNCTPNHLHYSINREILEAGRHLLCEKPLAVDASQAEELQSLAEERGLTTGVNFCYRYYPVVQEMACRVRRGEVGRVHSVAGHFYQDWLLYDTDYNWRLDKRFSGNSLTVADIGTHWCDLSQFVLGSRITEVMADLQTVIPVRKKSARSTNTFSGGENKPEELTEVPVELEDAGSVLVHFENGARGVFSVCQLCAGRKVSIDLQVYGTASSLEWRHERPNEFWQGYRDKPNAVFCENPLLQSKESARYARLPSGHPTGYADAMRNLFCDFYESIGRGDGAVKPPDFRDGWNEMKIVEAVLQSNAAKAWTSVRGSHSNKE